MVAQIMGGDFVIYAQIEKICKEKKIKITSLINEMNMSKGNLANWKKGGYPSVEVLIRIADYLQVSTDYLLGRTNIPEINK